MKSFETIIGVFGLIMSIFGVFGLRSLFKNATLQKRQKKIVKKVIDEYKKIDESADTRSDIDVLRKQ